MARQRKKAPKKKKVDRATRAENKATRAENKATKRVAKQEKKINKTTKRVVNQYTPYQRASDKLGLNDPLGRLDTSGLDRLIGQPSNNDPLGRLNTSAYDKLLNQPLGDDSLGRLDTSSFDKLLNQSLGRDSLGRLNTSAYDKLLNQSLGRDALGRLDTSAYDKLLNQSLGRDALGRLDTSAIDNLLKQPLRSAEAKQSLERNLQTRSRLSDFADKAGIRSQQTKNSFADLDRVVRKAEDALARSTQRSSQMSEILGIMKGGLAGLNSAENRALREQGLREARGELMGAKKRLNEANAKNLVRGGAANAGSIALEESFQRSLLQNEQDTLLANVQVQDNRRGQYFNSLNTVEDGERTAEQNALRTFGDAANSRGSLLRDVESNEFNQKASALDMFSQKDSDITNQIMQMDELEKRRFMDTLSQKYDIDRTNLSQGNTEVTNQQIKQRLYLDTLGQKQNDERTNLSQGNTEVANQQFKQRLYLDTIGQKQDDERTNLSQGNTEVANQQFKQKLYLDTLGQKYDADRTNLSQRNTEVANREIRQQRYLDTLGQKFDAERTNLSQGNSEVANRQLERNRLLDTIGLKFDADKINLSQGNIEQSRKIAGMLGIQGADLAKRNANRTYKLARGANKKSGGKSVSPSSATSGYDAYADEIDRLANQYVV